MGALKYWDGAAWQYAAIGSQGIPGITVVGGYTVFDDVGQPAAPNMWVAVTEVRELTFVDPNWVLGDVIDLIGPAGPGYVMIGTARQPAEQLKLLPYNQTVHLKVSAAAATLTAMGSATATQTGTQSAVAVAQNSPNADRLTTGGGAGSTAGSQAATNIFTIGASNDWAAAGFSINWTFRFNDASYNESGASTGSRIGVGVSSGGSIATVLAADTPTSNFIGFIRRSVNAGAIDANWLLVTRNGTGMVTLDTTMPFIAQNWYTLAMWVAPGGVDIGWRIQNRTAGTQASGLWTPANGYLPGVSQILGPFLGLITVDAVARSVDVNGYSVVTG